MDRVPYCLCLALCASILWGPAAARAEIYKWVDADGRVQFSDQPPAQAEAEEVRLSPINTFRGVSVEDYEAAETSGHVRPKRVVMYSADWCGVCTRAKRFFVGKGIPFQERDIERSGTARKEWERMNASGVPVILVGGKRMNGFSENRFRDLYEN